MVLGKSTLAKIIMGIEKQDSGQVILDGKDISKKKIDERAKLGIAFAFQYLVYLIQVYLIARKRYKFRFSDNFIQTYFSLLIALLLCLSIVLYFNGWQKYTFGVLIIIFCSSYCLFLLNKKIDLMGAIRSRIKK